MTDLVSAPLLAAGHLGLEAQMTIVTTLEEKALAALPKLAPWVKVQARHEPEVDIVSLINPEAPEGYRIGSVAIAAGRSSWRGDDRHAQPRRLLRLLHPLAARHGPRTTKERNPYRRLLCNVDHDLACRRSVLQRCIRILYCGQRKATGIDAGFDLPGFDQLRGFSQNLAVMSATLASQHREQGKDAGIGRGAERKRGERMRAPAERADDVTRTLDGCER